MLIVCTVALGIGFAVAEWEHVVNVALVVLGLGAILMLTAASDH
jgi:hypothetical protein